MTKSLPELAPLRVVQERLLRIFPEGSAYRGYCTREMAAKTVFTMLYIDAVEGSGRFAGPKHIFKMCDEQALLTSDAERLAYARDALKPGFSARGEVSWYADNSREPIRDETLRQGLIGAGAALDNKEVPTTSPRPRYSLAPDFAALFAPGLKGQLLEALIEHWQKAHLSKAALLRVALERAGAGADPTGIQVEFPNGETRRLSPGTSSVITKTVVEDFALRFLVKPAVLWLSESGNKVVARDDVLARRIGLHIDPSKSLPDLILVDLGTETLLVFVEVVATDGPISEARRKDLMALVPPGFPPEQVAFVTAFLSRDEAALRKAFAALAWNSFVWFSSEPDRIVALLGAGEAMQVKLHSLLEGGRQAKSRKP